MQAAFWAFTIAMMAWWIVGLGMVQWLVWAAGTRHLRPGLSSKDFHWMLVVMPAEFDSRMTAEGVACRKRAMRVLVAVGISQAIWFAVIYSALKAGLVH